MENKSEAASLDFALNMATELREDLIRSFKKLAEQNNTSEDKIQLAIRFRDLEDGAGEMYFDLMVGWKSVREANFVRDVLGIEGKDALWGDDTGKEATVKIYCLGYPQPPYNIEGMFSIFAKKHGITVWSKMNAVFYKITVDSQIKLGMFIPQDGTLKKVETIDIFNLNAPIDDAPVQEPEPNLEFRG